MFRSLFPSLVDPDMIILDDDKNRNQQQQQRRKQQQTDHLLEKLSLLENELHFFHDESLSMSDNYQRLLDSAYRLSCGDEEQEQQEKDDNDDLTTSNTKTNLQYTPSQQVQEFLNSWQQNQQQQFYQGGGGGSVLNDLSTPCITLVQCEKHHINTMISFLESRVQELHLRSMKRREGLEMLPDNLLLRKRRLQQEHEGNEQGQHQNQQHHHQHHEQEQEENPDSTFNLIQQINKNSSFSALQLQQQQNNNNKNNPPPFNVADFYRRRVSLLLQFALTSNRLNFESGGWSLIIGREPLVQTFASDIEDCWLGLDELFPDEVTESVLFQGGMLNGTSGGDKDEFRRHAAFVKKQQENNNNQNQNQNQNQEDEKNSQLLFDQDEDDEFMMMTEEKRANFVNVILERLIFEYTDPIDTLRRQVDLGIGTGTSNNLSSNYNNNNNRINIKDLIYRQKGKHAADYFENRQKANYTERKIVSVSDVCRYILTEYEEDPSLKQEERKTRRRLRKKEMKQRNKRNKKNNNNNAGGDVPVDEQQQQNENENNEDDDEQDEEEFSPAAATVGERLTTIVVDTAGLEGANDKSQILHLINCMNIVLARRRAMTKVVEVFDESSGRTRTEIRPKYNVVQGMVLVNNSVVNLSTQPDFASKLTNQQQQQQNPEFISRNNAFMNNNNQQQQQPQSSSFMMQHQHQQQQINNSTTSGYFGINNNKPFSTSSSNHASSIQPTFLDGLIHSVLIMENQRDLFYTTLGCFSYSPEYYFNKLLEIKKKKALEARLLREDQAPSPHDDDENNVNNDNNHDEEEEGNAMMKARDRIAGVRMRMSTSRKNKNRLVIEVDNDGDGDDLKHE